MKNFILSLTFFSCFLFISHFAISAQEYPNLYVAPYLNDHDLTNVFENSSKVLDYLEGDDIEIPVILFLATDDQYEVLRSKGIRSELIEEQADLSNYVYVYHPAANKTTQLSPYGTVYRITSHHTLLKISNPDTFEFKGELAQFSRLPLGQVIEKPIYTESSKSSALDLQNVTWAPAPFSWKNLFNILFPLILGTLLIVGAVWFINKKRKKDSVQNEQSL